MYYVNLTETSYSTCVYHRSFVVFDCTIVLICKLLWIKASAKLLNAKFAVRATDKYTIIHVVCEVYLKHLNITFLPGQWWNKQNIYFIMQIASINIEGASLKGYFNCKSKQQTSSVLATSQITLAYGQHIYKYIGISLGTFWAFTRFIRIWKKI